MPSLTTNQVRGFRAAWAGWALDGMDSFFHALGLVPALGDLRPRSGIPASQNNAGLYGGILFAPFSPEYRRRTIVNAALLLVSMVGLWAGSADAARIASWATMLPSTGTIAGCPALPFLAAVITFLAGAGVAHLRTIGIPVALTSIAFPAGLALLPLAEETRGKELPA